LTFVPPFPGELAQLARNLRIVDSWTGLWLEMEGWGVLLLILPTGGRGFGCGFCLIRFLFLQPLPALALILVHWNHFMWSKEACASLYLAISDRYGYCELCFKYPSEIKSKSVKWWKLWGYISWWESTFPVKLCREVREWYWEINFSYRLLATILMFWKLPTTP